MVIDSNMYWIPEEIFTDDLYLRAFLRCIPKEYGVYARCEIIPESGKKQIIIENPKGCPNLNYVQGEYLLEKQLSDMDLAGVNRAVLKIPCCQEWLDLELCRKFNSGMAEHVKRSNGRMSALAVIPPYGDRESIYELERCIDDLGMTGIQLSAHYGNFYLDHELFEPLFEVINRRKLPVYVHHTPAPVGISPINGYTNLRRSYGRCVDQTIAIGREVLSGMFDKWPDLLMIHSMLGGAFFAYMDSVFHKKCISGKDSVQRFTEETDKEYRQVRRHIYYEMSHAQPWGKTLLECAVKILGADHILFGSSYPVRTEWLTDGPGFVKEMELTEKEKALILGENASLLYRLY